MPRKTNKTSHVLNLLSNGAEPEVAEKQVATKEQKAEPESTVAVVQTSVDGDPLAAQIRTSLEGALEAETPQTQQTETPARKKKNQPEVTEKVSAPIPLDEPPTQTRIKKGQMPTQTGGEFEFVSVMEHLLDRELLKYMHHQGMCTCSRCQTDVIALTLTNLPAKYVVAVKGEVSPLLDYYGTKYNGRIAVELTKACLRIAEHPHH